LKWEKPLISILLLSLDLRSLKSFSSLISKNTFSGIIWTDHALKNYREKSDWDIATDYEQTNLLDEAVDDMYSQFESLFRNGYLDPENLTIHYAQILMNAYWLVESDGALGLLEVQIFKKNIYRFFSFWRFSAINSSRGFRQS
jgi:hypothetical protein